MTNNVINTQNLTIKENLTAVGATISHDGYSQEPVKTFTSATMQK